MQMGISMKRNIVSHVPKQKAAFQTLYLPQIVLRRSFRDKGTAIGGCWRLIYREQCITEPSQLVHIDWDQASFLIRWSRRSPPSILCILPVTRKIFNHCLLHLETGEYKHHACPWDPSYTHTHLPTVRIFFIESCVVSVNIKQSNCTLHTWTRGQCGARSDLEPS